MGNREMKWKPFPIAYSHAPNVPIPYSLIPYLAHARTSET
jgi:hypothetical protein